MTGTPPGLGQFSFLDPLPEALIRRPLITALSIPDRAKRNIQTTQARLSRRHERARQ